MGEAGRSLSGGALDPRFLDHVKNPRNVGELEGATVAVEVENPVCGDRLRLALAIDGDRIARARFRSSGCSGALAAASVLTERVIGIAVKDARAIDADAIEASLGGMGALKRHGADLAADALKAALRAIDARP